MAPSLSGRLHTNAGRVAPALLVGLLALVALAAGAWWFLGASPHARVRVQRLRPVLVDTGRPSVEEAIEARIVEEVRFRAGLTGWVPYNARLSTVEEALEGRPIVRDLVGLVVFPDDTRTEAARAEGAPLSAPQLLAEGLAWDADRIRSLVVRVEYSQATIARVYFRTAEDEERQRDQQAAQIAAGKPARHYFPGGNYVETAVQASAGQRPWSIEVGQHPAWRGTVTALRLDLVQVRDPYVIDYLAAIERELAAGPSPETDGDTVLDAGLIELAFDPREADPGAAVHEARRSVPALAGRPQAAWVDVEPGSTLRYSVGLPPEFGRLSGPIEFEVVAVPVAASATDPPEAWLPELVEEEETPVDRFVLDPERDGGRWHARAVPLAFGGETAFVLRTSGGTGEGRLNGFWGPLWIYPEGRETVPSVVLITADTLRADHVGHYARELGLPEIVETPVIDALAARGAAFLDTLAPCNATSPSHASILTGLYPKDHGVLGNQTLLPEEVQTLAELMRQSGRVTIGSSSVRHLNARLSGMSQGVDVYLDTPPLIPGKRPPGSDELPPGVRPPPVENVREAYRGAGHVHGQLFPLLEEIGAQPFFLWVHYYDPHTPYRSEQEYEQRYAAASGGQGEPLLQSFARARAELHPYLRSTDAGGDPRELSEQELLWNYLADHPHLDFLGDTGESEFVRALYRAGVAQLDRDVGRLFDRLEELGRMDETVVAFTADHGESLGERDIWFDHQGVYDNTLRIPLVLAGPGVSANSDVRDPVEVIDLVPTVCELLDVRAPEVLRGRSLVPLLSGESGGPRRRWFQYSGNLEVGFQDEDEHFLLSTVAHPRGTFDMPIAKGHRELYDRRVDPELLRDLASERSERAAAAQREVETWLAERALDVRAMQSDLDASDRLALAGLGYTDAALPDEPPNRDGDGDADPEGGG